MAGVPWIEWFFCLTRKRTPAGETTDVTEYTYDPLGSLRKVVLPDGRVIEYVIDPQGRRIAKKVGGVIVQRLLWSSQLRPIAELDEDGEVLSRFVYANGVNSPEYMIRDGRTYRLIKDHLGSPRLVVDVANGDIAQRLDYDAWGNVLSDSNPGFQPFGFAGGLYDPDSGFVRFGARDYDPEVGRWTAKDPIGFRGGDTNVYAYSASDPVNYLDYSGRSRWAIVRRVKGAGVEIIEWVSRPRAKKAVEAGEDIGHPWQKSRRDLAKDLGDDICATEKHGAGAPHGHVVEKPSFPGQEGRRKENMGHIFDISDLILFVPILGDLFGTIAPEPRPVMTESGIIWVYD